MYANPLELAKAELGDQIDPVNCGPFDEADKARLISLQKNARYHGFLNEKFWVNTEQGMIIPSKLPDKTEDLEVRYVLLHNVAFSGVLKSFHKYSLGGGFGSWCMNFEESVLAPTMEEVSEEDELWVPTASVKKIEPL